MNFPKGTCEKMCPNKEAIWREQQDLLHKFEMLDLNDKQKSKANINKIVKQYSRSAADKAIISNSELRTSHTLLKTMEYLMKDVISKAGVPWPEIYMFIQDRVRAVYQDMIIQRLEDKICVHILEMAVRFHTYASFRLFESEIISFDPYLNNRLLDQYLQTLLDLYQKCISNSNQNYMTALFLIRHLNNKSALKILSKISLKITNEAPLSTVIEMNMAFMNRNYLRLIRKSKKLSFLLACSFQQHLPIIQREALQVVCTAYCSKVSQLPVKALVSWIGFNNGIEAIEFCNFYGIKLDKTSTILSLQKGIFQDQNERPPCYQAKYIQDKQMNLSLSDVLTGKV